MPRKGRIVLPGYPHHILHRGHNRQAVFQQEDDYLKCLADIKELKKDFRLDVYAWCLLPNEVHLLLNPGDDTAAMGTFMKFLAARMTRFRNHREGRRGTLWESRYRSSPVQPSWLLACDRYLETLPARYGDGAGSRVPPWISSHHERMHPHARRILDPDPAYLALAASEESRRRAYADYLALTPSSDETAIIRNSVERNQLTGGADFTDEVERLTGERISRRGRGRPRKPSG